MDDPTLENYDLPERADQFVFYFTNMSLNFLTKHLLHCVGSDFQYSNANMWYKNLDKLINYINTNKEIYNVYINYSTPGIYLQTINQL